MLNQLPKSMQPKLKAELHELWLAATREDEHCAFYRTPKRFEPNYPQALDFFGEGPPRPAGVA